MKQGRFKYHSIDIPLYFGSLHIYIGENLNEVTAAAHLPIGPIKNRQPDEWDAIAFEADNGDQHGAFVLLRPDATPKVIAHEAVHLVHFIMRRVGMIPDLANDESEAYLMGWVVGEIHYALTSKKVKPKKTIHLR